MIIRRRNVLIPFLALLAAAPCLAGSHADAEEFVRKSLLHKTLVLRNYYKGSNLSYDQNGNPTSNSDSGTWVSDGAVLISGVHFRGDVLEIRGERVVLYYGPDKRIKGTPTGRKVHITIALGANADEDAATRALQRVFYQNGESGTAPAPPNDYPLVMRFDKATTPPKPLYTPDPQYDSGARGDGIQGTVVTAVVIDSLGRIATLQITRSLDPRLDGQAALALSEWRFQPGQRDGNPVACLTNIEINFRFY